MLRSYCTKTSNKVILGNKVFPNKNTFFKNPYKTNKNSERYTYVSKNGILYLFKK